MQELLTPVFLIFLSVFCFIAGVSFAIVVSVLKRSNERFLERKHYEEQLFGHSEILDERRYQNEMSSGNSKRRFSMNGKVPDSLFLNSLRKSSEVNASYVEHMKQINQSIEYSQRKK